MSDDEEHWQRPRNEQGDFIAEDETMSDNDTEDDTEDGPDAQTDDELDESIREAGGTTSSRARYWKTNDYVAGAFAGTTCLLTLSYVILPAAGVDPADPPMFAVALLGVGLFASLAWQYGVDALVAAVEAWNGTAGSGGDDK